MGARTERPAPGEQVPVARSAPGSQQAVASQDIPEWVLSSASPGCQGRLVTFLRTDFLQSLPESPNLGHLK